MAAPLIEHRIGLFSVLSAVGLVIQPITYIWIHPLAFIAFLLISCPLVAIGILIYLYSLVTTHPPRVASAMKLNPNS